jgi:phosphatidylinositol glycan class N
MGGLLIFKILLPIMFVMCTCSAIVRVHHINASAIYFIMLSIADVCVLQFFFCVKNTGSWLEIGNSISHYAISSLYIVVIPILFFISQQYVMRCQARDDARPLGGVHGAVRGQALNIVSYHVIASQGAE